MILFPPKTLGNQIINASQKLMTSAHNYGGESPHEDSAEEHDNFNQLDNLINNMLSKTNAIVNETYLQN